MNFLACDREQAFLMPPDPRDWLPEGHLAWFVLAPVEEITAAPRLARERKSDPTHAESAALATNVTKW